MKREEILPRGMGSHPMLTTRQSRRISGSIPNLSSCLPSCPFVGGLLLILILTTFTRAAPPELKTPEGAFDVYEWVIFVCDPAQPQANSAVLYPSTLPDFMQSRRTPAPLEKSSEPQPVGVIRFQGDSGKDTVDIQITNKGAKFLSLWPKAQTRSNAALWQNFTISTTAPASQEQLAANSWINQLRSATGFSFVNKESHGENFLLYDAEPNYKFPLHVAAGSDADHYQLTNSEKIALHEVMFYKQTPGGWHTGMAATLNPTAATKPVTTKPAATKSVAASSPATTSAATTQSTGLALALSGTSVKDSAQVLAPWKEKLTATGLPAADCDLIIAILQRHALDTKRLTAIYRLDADELDQLLPLEVTPQPRKTVRIGLVIAKNIDPAIVHEVEDLVAQLGDNSWEKRQAAQESLQKLGPAARPKLESLLKNAKDPEITYRIEQLLAALATPPSPPNPNGG